MPQHIILNDFQVLVLRRLQQRKTLQEIASDPAIKVTKHWIHVQLRKMERIGLTKNVRPGRALGWEVTKDGLDLLKNDYPEG